MIAATSRSPRHRRRRQEKRRKRHDLGLNGFEDLDEVAVRLSGGGGDQHGDVPVSFPAQGPSGRVDELL